MRNHLLSLARLSHVLFLSVSQYTVLAAEPSERFNIVVIVADDLRADVMSVYGGPVPTPNLEKLAGKGTRFLRAISGYPICHVSRSEMLCGRALVKEASTPGSIPFDRSWTLWPQLMRTAGWRTVYSGKWHVAGTPVECGYSETAGLYSPGSPTAGLLTLSSSATDRKVTGYVGWTFKDANGKEQPQHGIGLTPQTDALITAAAVEQVRKPQSQPLFLHVNFTAPHDPLHWPTSRTDSYAAEQVLLPANFQPQHAFEHGNLVGRDELIVPAPRTAGDVRRERAVYYAIVENLDAQVGQLLSAIHASPNPESWLVIFTSDQGLALGSHGLMGKQNQYEHTVNVPLILAGPGIPAGLRTEHQCALRDLFPTVCELTSHSIPASVQGTSVMSILRNKPAPSFEYVFGYFTDTQRMIRTADGWKLIWYPKQKRIQLFQTKADPQEQSDLSQVPAQRGRIRQLKQRLRDWQQQHGDKHLVELEPH